MLVCCNIVHQTLPTSVIQTHVVSISFMEKLVISRLAKRHILIVKTVKLSFICLLSA